MGARVLPDKNTLQKWYSEELLTYQAMADRFNSSRPGEKPVTHVAFHQACKRHGFPPRNMSHADVLPANMDPDHVKLYDTEMIRMWDCRRKGKTYPPKIDQKINAWLQNLHDAKVVLIYKRRTLDGWKPVPRVPTDIKGCPVRL